MQHDEYDRFTFRREEDPMPSSELQEELQATIFRFAKERFQKRAGKSVLQSTELEGSGGDESDRERVSPAPAQSAASIKAESSEEDSDHMAVDSGNERQTPGSEADILDPVMSADDDLANQLLSAPVRHILSHLDDTLTVLHNSRVAGLSYLSNSSTEDDSDNQSPRRKRSRGRPRSTSRPIEAAASSDPPKITRRGRPKKLHIPVKANRRKKCSSG